MCERKTTVFTECGHKKTHSVHVCRSEKKRLQGAFCFCFSQSQARHCKHPEKVEEQRSILCRQCREGTRGAIFGDVRGHAQVYRDSTGDAREAAREAAEAYGWNSNRETLGPDLLHDFYANGGGPDDIYNPDRTHHQVPGINFNEWNNYQSNRGFYPQPRGALPARPDEISTQLGRDIDATLQYTNTWGR